MQRRNLTDYAREIGARPWDAVPRAIAAGWKLEVPGSTDADEDRARREILANSARAVWLWRR